MQPHEIVQQYSDLSQLCAQYDENQSVRFGAYLACVLMKLKNGKPCALKFMLPHLADHTFFYRNKPIASGTNAVNKPKRRSRTTEQEVLNLWWSEKMRAPLSDPQSRQLLSTKATTKKAYVNGMRHLQKQHLFLLRISQLCEQLKQKSLATEFCVANKAMSNCLKTRYFGQHDMQSYFSRSLGGHTSDQYNINVRTSTFDEIRTLREMVDIYEQTDLHLAAQFEQTANQMARFKHLGRCFFLETVHRGLTLEETFDVTLSTFLTHSLDYRFDTIVRLVRAVAFLHANDICHHDLSESNVMIHDKNVKVIDFGFARVMSNKWCKDRSGTPFSWSPQILLSKEGWHSDGKLDSFAVGALCHRILHGQTLHGQVKNLPELKAKRRSLQDCAVCFDDFIEENNVEKPVHLEILRQIEKLLLYSEGERQSVWRAYMALQDCIEKHTKTFNPTSIASGLQEPCDSHVSAMQWDEQDVVAECKMREKFAKFC